MQKKSTKLRTFLVLSVVFMILFFSISLFFFSEPSLNYNNSNEDENPDQIYQKINEEQNNTIGEDELENNTISQEKIYVEYDDSYRTLKYNVWERYKEDNETTYLAKDAVVARRGSSIDIIAPSDAEMNIIPSNNGMTSLEEQDGTVEIPSDSTIGTYAIEAEGNGWKDSMSLFVIYDPWQLDLSEEKRQAYAYDEGSDRSNYSFIYTTSGNFQTGNLRPFGEERKGINFPDMYEFALRATAGVEDPQEAAVRLLRIVAQRNKAVPSSFDEQPILRDAGTILFGGGETTIHDSQYQVTGLDLDDAEILAENDESIPGIDGLTEDGYSKIINGWCDETSLALAGLLRSIGIPSRIVSIHPDEETTELMGHFMNEVYFENSLYDTSEEDEGGWYVMDADSWNAEWYFEDPTFWMPMGELYTSRYNFNQAVETLFRVNYEYDVESYYIPPIKISEETDMVDVTEEYKSTSHFDLDYGSIEKYMGRGGGDYFRVDIEENSKLSLESSGGTESQLYVNKEKYPALKISYQGYPPELSNLNLTDSEITLGPGTYYIGIYAAEENEANLEGKPYQGHHLPERGDPSLIGNYGKYELTLKETPESNPVTKPDMVEDIEFDRDSSEVELEWSEPYDGGSKINQYIIYRDGEEIARTETNRFIDEELEKDKYYQYEVTAVNFMGESETDENSMVTISTHEKAVYEENQLQFVISILLFMLWVGSYVGIKKLERSSN